MKNDIRLVGCPICSKYTPLKTPKKKRNARKLWKCDCGNEFSVMFDHKRGHFTRIKLLKEAINDGSKPTI